MRSLLVYPTHENGQEVLVPYLAAGLNAACFPGRSTNCDGPLPQNCWNPQADEAERIGLPVVKAVCPGCDHARFCHREGYLAELAAAKEADIVICTHKRAEYSSLRELAAGRKYISIHENPIDLLRPMLSLTEPDLLRIQSVLDRMLNDPYFLNWFGAATKQDELGNTYVDEALSLRKERLYEFSLFLADLVDRMVIQLQSTEQTMEWKPDESLALPDGIERTLFWATSRLRELFAGPAWWFILVAASGELHSSAIVVERRFRKGGGTEPTYVLRSFLGVRINRPPANAVTWFNDATISPDRLSMVLNAEVRDETPDGRIELQKKAVQILRDVTRRTKPRIVANVLRGVLADRPQFERVGIICHRPHLSALNQLGAEYESRIVKETYFGSGDERSSNDWHHLCDLIVVVGTPRVPPRTIASYLIQVGEVDAACREPQWGTLYWYAATESGETVKVASRGYQDEAWRRAHQDLVRAQIVQAVGRGRVILVTGCEVVVLSNEECGLVVSDAGLEPMGGTCQQVLDAVNRLTITNAKKDYLAKVIVSTKEVASATGLSTARSRQILRGLEHRGLIHKVGERGGWLPVTHHELEAAPCND